MRKHCWLILFVFGISVQGFSQGTFLSQNTGGSWNSAATWILIDGSDADGLPDADDIAIIAVDPGSFVSFPRAGSNTFQIKDIYIQYDVANVVRTSGFTGAPSLLVHGQLSGVDMNSGEFEVPTVNLFASNMSSLPIIFTGSNLDDPISGSVLGSWGHTTPLISVAFNPGIGNELRLESFSVQNSATISSGTVRLISGHGIRASGVSSHIIINSGATLNTTGVITGDGTPTSVFPLITVNGTLTTTTNSYVNAEQFIVTSTGVVNVGFSNATNQTEGWWYQSTRPTTLSLNPASNVIFNAPATQRIYTAAYGNLNLSGTGAKSFVGDETMTIHGEFNIQSSAVTVNSTKSIYFEGGIYNDGSFTSSQPVFFQGTEDQKIEGSASFTLNNGLTINKSGGILLLDKNISVGGGLTISAGTLDLGDKTLTLTSGNISKSGGTLTADVGPTGGTIVVNGTTSVSGTSAITFNNLTIGATGVLTAHGTSMSITGDFNNNGTFNRNSGTVVFAGTTQIIGGSSATRFNNMTIQTGSSVTNENSASLRLDGILNIQGSGTFDVDGSSENRTFIVSSSSLVAGGKIAALPSPATSLTGSFRVERFLDGPDTWRYLSSPVVGANLSMWRDDFPVTGTFSDASPAGVNGVVSSTAPSVYRYRSSNANTTEAYVALSGASTSAVPLTNGLGYSAYTYLPGNFTITVTGTHRNVASFSQSGLASGFHLLGNPYPCPIDFDLLGKSNVSSTVYLRTANNEFTTWNGVAIAGAGNPPFAGWSGELATGQAFWVESLTGSGSVTFSESAKITSQNQYVRQAAASDYLRISLRQGTQRDDAIVMFREDATDDFDLQYEGTKNKNGNLSGGIYSHVNLGTVNSGGDRVLTYNALPWLSYSETKSVFLSVADVKQGNAFLIFSDLETFDRGYTIIFHDLFLNKQIQVTEGYRYDFEVTENPLTSGNNRFRLDFVNLITALPGEENDGIQLYPNPATDKIKIAIPDFLANKVKGVVLYDIRGSEVMQVGPDPVRLSGDIELDLTSKQKGIYLIRIITSSRTYNLRFVKR